MNIEKIARSLSELGNEHKSLFSGTRFFYVGRYDMYRNSSGNYSLIIEIHFPLHQMNPTGDSPKNVLTLVHEDEFSPAHTESSVVEIIYGYALEYAEHYVKPIAKIIPTLNRGKHFNHPKGWNA